MGDAAYVRKRYRILLLILLVAVAGGLAWHALWRREPVYKGKPLSYWLKGYYPHDGVTPQQADEAVRHLGTNATPTLLRLLRKRDSALKLKVLGLLRKQQLLKIDPTPAVDINYRAGVAFGSLREQASNAVPDLIAIYHQHTSEAAQNAVVIALSHIGPSASEAVPLLVEAAARKGFAISANSVDALMRIHSQPALTIPVLVKCLGSRDSDIRKKAAFGLGAFGAEASNAVPDMLPLLTDRDQFVRQFTTNALMKIAPEAVARAGVK